MIKGGLSQGNWADDEQGVCGFRAGESDFAFLLREFHQLKDSGLEGEMLEDVS